MIRQPGLTAAGRPAAAAGDSDDRADQQGGRGQRDAGAELPADSRINPLASGAVLRRAWLHASQRAKPLLKAA